jgi:mono/diheme cytochrome c family protein
MSEQQPQSGQRRLLIPVALSAVLTVAIAGAGLWFFQQSQAPGVPPLDRQKVALGQVVYTQSCAVCHGTNLEGQANWQDLNSDGRFPAPPHDNSGHTWHHTDEILLNIINDGSAAFVGGDYQSDMIGYRDILSAEEIVAVLEFIKSNWGPDERAFQEQLNQQARDVAQSIAEQAPGEPGS